MSADGALVRVALPTGDARAETAGMLEAAGCGIPDYAAGSRSLRFPMAGGTAIARVFREKDVPVQVALGNYDIGICNRAWIEELTQRYGTHEVVALRDLGFGAGALWIAAAGEMSDLPVRIASEYPNIADVLARRLRLRRYRIFPVHGAAEAFPPEDADLALIAAADEGEVEAHGLRPLHRVLDCSTWLIANRHSLATKDRSALLAQLLAAGSPAGGAGGLSVPADFALRTAVAGPRNKLRLALPDGHQQPHTVAALEAAGLRVCGYGDGEMSGRPRLEFDGDIEVKVIRPQDMPQQVAIGNFDLAVTGRDSLFDHLVQFPSSPVEEVVDLGRARYALAAIVKGVAADTVSGAVAEWRARSAGPIRIASEYPNIADHFARERHLGRYSIIPIAGASEGFVPDDAEILIEGIDTGSSVRANNLTVLERFFESTNCVIANKLRPEGAMRATFDALVERLCAGAAQPVAVAGGA